jgi:hypothetical protein
MRQSPKNELKTENVSGASYLQLDGHFVEGVNKPTIG